MVIVAVVLIALSVPLSAAGAQQTDDEVTLAGSRKVTLKPRAGAPSEAGALVGSPPNVTGSASVDTAATAPRGVATVSARGRNGEYRVRYGAAFSTVAGSNPNVVGHLQVRIKNLHWAGELRWDGKITDYASARPGGPPDGCRGCLIGEASADLRASVVNLDTGELLATETVASPRRTFAGPAPVTDRVSGRRTLALPSFDVSPNANLAVYVALTVSATSRLRPEATTGAATADFGTAGEGTGGTTSGKQGATTRPGKDGPKGVSYDDITVELTGTDSTVVQSRCTATELTPRAPSEVVLVDYFQAIDAGDYGEAFALLDADLQAGWAAAGPTSDGAANFATFMATHVECVQVTDVIGRDVVGEVGEEQSSASLGIRWYEVTLDARYISPFPAGSGGFQSFYKVRVEPHSGPNRPPDQIIDIATSLPSGSTTSSSTLPGSSTSSSTTSSSTTSSSTTSSSTTTTSTTRPLSGPTAIVSMGDSFISGEAGRWNGNALNPLFGRSGTDRAYTGLQPITVFPEGGGITGFFGGLANDIVGTIIYVPTYNANLVYPGSDGGSGCHRSDVAEVNAQLPGITKHINLACSGGTTDAIFRTVAGGQPFKGEAPQADQLVQVAKTNQVRVILLSIGGNDLHFADIVKNCVLDYGSGLPIRCELEDGPTALRRLDPANHDVDNVVHRVEKAIDEVRAAMENPQSKNSDPLCMNWQSQQQSGSVMVGDYCGAGYARSQYRIVLQSYPSPVPSGNEFRVAEKVPLAQSLIGSTPLTTLNALAYQVGDARIALGCPFWDSDATWARDTLVPLFSDRLAAIAASKQVGFLDLRDFLEGREICSNQTRNEGFTGTPSASGSEWARAIYVLAQANAAQGDDKEAIHPNAYGQQGLQRCAASAYDYVWNQNLPTVRLKCINQPGGFENVTTQVLP